MGANGNGAGLTPKQEAFAREYLVDLNATKAAIRAGYSAKSAEKIGYQLLEKTRVRAKIQEGQTNRSKRTEITADYVLETIRDTVERCRQGEPVKDREGHPTGEWRFDSNAVLKGCELLGKHLALFKDKVEISGEVDFKDILEQVRK